MKLCRYSRRHPRKPLTSWTVHSLSLMAAMLTAVSSLFSFLFGGFPYWPRRGVRALVLCWMARKIHTGQGSGSPYDGLVAKVSHAGGVTNSSTLWRVGSRLSGARRPKSIVHPHHLPRRVPPLDLIRRRVEDAAGRPAAGECRMEPSRVISRRMTRPGPGGGRGGGGHGSPARPRGQGRAGGGRGWRRIRRGRGCRRGPSSRRRP